MNKLKKYPGSAILKLLVMVSALFTFAVLFFLIGHILMNGIPHLSLNLFALEYNTENVSMMPASINTLTISVLA